MLGVIVSVIYSKNCIVMVFLAFRRQNFCRGTLWYNVYCLMKPLFQNFGSIFGQNFGSILTKFRYVEKGMSHEKNLERRPKIISKERNVD